MVIFKYSIYANNCDNDDNGDDGDDGDEEKDHWTKGLVGWDMVAPPTLVSHKTGNAKRIENHRHHLKIIVSPLGNYRITTTTKRSASKSQHPCNHIKRYHSGHTITSHWVT